MMAQIQEQHLQKLAYVYLRQSTLGQVLHHSTSTERQYDLTGKALEMGWPRERIRVLDGDLASSAKPLSQRADFTAMTADVAMKRVGAIFVLECSRLARSNSQWHRLLELCALSDTLIVEGDTCYHPVQLDDQLVLTIKGAMSHAELHMMHHRLYGGRRHKAGQGTLRFALPAGYRHDERGLIVKDPDEQVREAVGHLFDAFRSARSAYGVAVQFNQEGRLFPKRAGGGRNGRLKWGPLTLKRAVNVLRHPCYAGAYAWGQRHTTQTLSDQGQVCQRVESLPMEQWPVLIRDHHDGYVSWDEWMANRKTIAGNAPPARERPGGGSAREGHALLQGLLWCGRCGRKLRTRYQGTGGCHASYVCEGQRPDGAMSKASCLSLSAATTDPVVVERALALLEPVQAQLAVQAWAEVERRQAAQDRQWLLRVEAARYEADLARQRYEAADPKRRLSTDALEEAWNDALVRLQETEAQHAAHRQTKPPGLDAGQKARVKALAENLPQLWSAPSTQAKQRKQILRLIIKDVFVDRGAAQDDKAVLHVRWQGGGSVDLLVGRPLRRWDQVRYQPETVAEIRALARTRNDRQVAEHLNGQGRLSMTGKPFTRDMIQAIRRKHDIPDCNPKGEDELTVREVAERFGVRTDRVRSWIEHGILPARQRHPHMEWRIVLDPEKEKELWRRVKDVRGRDSKS